MEKERRSFADGLACVLTARGSVAVFGGIILGRDDQTAALSRTPEYRLDNVDQLLNILILYISL